MITYSRLGENGRLGNQLWQIASTIGLARLHRETFTFPKWKYADRFEMPPEWFSGAMGTESDTLALRLPMAARPYLQDSYYVRIAEPTIRKAFRIRSDEFITDMSRWLNVRECAAVHVRRGDYAEEWRGHGMLERDWYLAHWPADPVLVFSDDPEWCEENLPGRVCHFDEIDDLALMSRCRELLISNSSFAWWGAWISGNPVTYPDPWFTAAQVGDMHWTGWKRVHR